MRSPPEIFGGAGFSFLFPPLSGNKSIVPPPLLRFLRVPFRRVLNSCPRFFLSRHRRSTKEDSDPFCPFFFSPVGALITLLPSPAEPTFHAQAFSFFSPFFGPALMRGPSLFSRLAAKRRRRHDFFTFPSLETSAA